MTYDTFLDRFHTAQAARKVLTNPELEAAHEAGLDPVELAGDNDRLAAEYDEMLAAESRAAT